jgi:[protein-PII] uridylyltransferase
VDVGTRDRPGLLASVTGALVECGLDVREAIVATWPDRAALESFRVTADEVPAPARVQAAVEVALDAPPASAPLPEAVVSFDDDASPWHTVCELRAPDKPGLLHALANAFAAARVEVHSASISADDGTAVDRFDVTDRDGHKLDEGAKSDVERFISGGVATRRRRFRRTAFAITLV